MALDPPTIQAAIAKAGLDGWLLYDFRGLNAIAVNLVSFPEAGHRTRRWFYYIPARGEPQKLVHGIESGVLDHLPGEKHVYSRWQAMEKHLVRILDGAESIAMEYSPRGANPYVSRVDAGTIELVTSLGVQVVSSGDLIQQFEASLSDDQIASHLAAAKLTDEAFTIAWDFIAEQVRTVGETDEISVRDRILRHFEASGLVTDHSPIVGVGPNGGDPHYETGTGRRTTIAEGDYVLIDLWAKQDHPDGIYSDLTRVAVVGNAVPGPIADVFANVASARDAAVDLVRRSFGDSEPLAGWQVDRAARDVIEAAGYGAAFVHRTGHSIGAETHGNGTHMDDFETHDERRLIPRTVFSIEPGIYLPEFGIRSEINVLIDAKGTVRITGGEPQRQVQCIAVGSD